MAKSKPSSVVLVIDASIARAAGPENATHPTAKHCRDFLLAVVRICHRIGMSPAIADEWKRHRSGFSRQWLVSMHARKKVVNVSATEDRRLREIISKNADSETTRKVMLKDAHLLEAAIEADRRIASLDDIVKNLFADACVKYKAVQTIGWVNPDKEFDEVLAWLELGAPLDKVRQLLSR